MHITVRCADGNVRHTGTFDNRADASYWAAWGHACTSEHTFHEHHDPVALVSAANDVVNALSRLARMVDPDYAEACLDTVMTMERPTTDAQRVVFDLQAVGFMLNASGLCDRDEAAVVRYQSYREG